MLRWSLISRSENLRFWSGSILQEIGDSSVRLYNGWFYWEPLSCVSYFVENWLPKKDQWKLFILIVLNDNRKRAGNDLSFGISTEFELRASMVAWPKQRGLLFEAFNLFSGIINYLESISSFCLPFAQNGSACFKVHHTVKPFDQQPVDLPNEGPVGRAAVWFMGLQTS